MKIFNFIALIISAISCQIEVNKISWRRFFFVFYDAGFSTAWWTKQTQTRTWLEKTIGQVHVTESVH